MFRDIVNLFKRVEEVNQPIGKKYLVADSKDALIFKMAINNAENKKQYNYDIIECDGEIVAIYMESDYEIQSK